METNLRSLNLSSQRAAAHFAYAVWRCSEYFQPLEAAPSAAISRKWAESAILSDLLYLDGPLIQKSITSEAPTDMKFYYQWRNNFSLKTFTRGQKQYAHYYLYWRSIGSRIRAFQRTHYRTPKIQDGWDTPSWKPTWRHINFAGGGPIWIKFSR